ncbi:MAG: ABC transporter ATP-binding protein [Bradyrhizobium sp.]|nr:MAG: ABC transporter ATP-binding protein [Bradyrhizobium sp.]
MRDGSNGWKAGDDLLKLSAVSSGYGAVTIVKDISLTIKRGEIFAVMGKNGMGKTTLLKTILGFIELKAGDVTLEGASLRGVAPAKLIASGVAYAPQDQPLFQDLSIRDNIRLALRSDREFKNASERAFSYFPFLRDRLGQKAGTLSGGEQKMLTLARSLMHQPKMLLVDEVSEGLQPSVVDRIAAALKNERDANGVTILMVEQNLDFALRVADRWAILKLGAIDDQGGMESNTRERVLEHLKI